MSRFAVTVVSPPGYVHSGAFREVAETLHHGLKALGHDATLTDDLRPPGRRPIVLGANLLPAIKRKPAKDAILYNLEQLDPGSPWLTPELLALLRKHEVWDYSARNAGQYAALGLPAPRVVPIGYVPELTRIPPASDEDIDVLFYGSVNERRRRVLEALRARGLRVEAVFGVYGEARDRLIARSKLVLNIHFYGAKVFEIVRVSYLLANRRCVVSERGAGDDDERALEAGVAFAPYEALVDTCVRLVADPTARARIARAGLELMSSRDEAAYLRAALALPAAAPRQPATAPPAQRSTEMTPADLPPLSIDDVVAIAQPSGRRVLSVACGDGELGAALLAQGAAEVVGLDPCARGLARARLSAVYRLDPDAAPELPYPAGYFDLLLLEDFSRLVAPAPALLHLRRWLADTGRVVCVAPNAQHEAALASLLLRGGLPPHGGARPATIGAALDALAAAGFQVEDEVILQRTDPGPAAEPIAQLAASLGADAALLADGLTLVRAVLGARPGPAGHRQAPAFADPWRGSRAVKVLVAPDLAAARDWVGPVAELARGLDRNMDVTLGIALPTQLLDRPPAALQQATEGLRLDVLLTEAPISVEGWQRLLAGATTYLSISPRPDLISLARGVGVDVQIPA